MNIVRFFTRQIDEIKADPALRIYGIFVAFGYLLTYVFWRETNVPHMLANTSAPICWPFFQDCYTWRIFTQGQVNALLKLLGVGSVAAMALFATRRTAALAYGILTAVFVLKTAILFQDFQLRLNQHYMLFFISVVYLFLPYKRNLLRYTLVAFYVGAGSIKFNQEWCSGAAMYRDPLFIHGQWIPPACVYVVILEFFLAYGVLARNKWIFWLTYAQLVWFHVVSYGVVKYFYSFLMIGLLMIFPLARFMPRPQDEPESLWTSLVKFKQPIIVYAFLGLFAFLQIYPKVMPGDEEVTGEGRLFALNMFDAQMVCEGAITLRYKDGTAETVTIPQPGLAWRTKCDPASYYSRARWMCWKNKDNPEFADLDLYFASRRNSETDMRPRVDIKDFCAAGVRYNVFTPNEWIRKE